MKKQFFTIMAFFLALLSNAQSFTEQSQINFEQVSSSAIKWADMNNDNNLDLLIAGVSTGTPYFKYYQSSGSGNFVEISTSIIGVYNCAVEVADFNNDGWLDIIVSGQTSGIPTMESGLYFNQGDDTFTLQSLDFPALKDAAIDCGDFNNDGWIDFVITGSDGSRYMSLYKNTGEGVFELVTGNNFQVVSNGDIKFFDYDLDTDLDIIYCGWDFGLYNELYINNGDETFTLDTENEFPGLYMASIDIGDYNNDGYPDLFFTGATEIGSPYSPETSVYTNNNDGTFSLLTGSSITGIYDGALSPGDYDNDGDLDFVEMGKYTTSGLTSKLYENNSSFGIFDDAGVSFTNGYLGDLKWADYDNDGDIDLLETGTTGGAYTKLWKNDVSNVNQPPSAPISIYSIVDTSSVVIKWSPANDDNTPEESLTYNIAVGSTTDSANVLVSNSDLNTGFYKIAEYGNAQYADSLIIRGLQDGTYYYRVQAIDNCFKASEFSEIGSFEIGTTTNVEYTTRKEITIFPNPTKDLVFITGIDINKIEVLNVNGQIINELDKNNSGNYKVNLSARSKGLYLIKIYTNDEIIIKKIVFE